MTPSGGTADAVRGALIAAGACTLAWSLMALRGRRLALVLLVLWSAIPALAIGYAWAALPGAWLHEAIPVQVLHGVLAAFRLAPLTLMIACLLPAPRLNAAAFHCLRLSRRRSRAALAWDWWSRGPGRIWLVAALTVFPLAFSEFEIASRLDVGVWAVRLFDAQAGGQYLAVTLLQALPGSLVQFSALACAWLLIAGRLGAPPGALSAEPAPRRLLPAWLVLAAGSALLLGVPAGTLACDAGNALVVAIAQASMLRFEIMASLVFAGVSALCAWLIAGVLASSPAPSAFRRLLQAALMLPGLLGSLFMGVGVLALSQLPFFRPLSDTPLPLTIALVLLLLPFALVLRLFVERLSAPAAWHQAQSPKAGDGRRAAASAALDWALSGRRRWWCFAVIFAWAYGDLAASAILHPVDMTPVLVRLYNLMHYGRSSALSVQLAMALLAGLAALAAAHACLRIAQRVLAQWSARVRTRGLDHV